MVRATIPQTAAVVRGSARAIAHHQNDYDGLLDAIADAQFVLIGEASHGTHEFYRERAKITQRLIAEKGFQGVAVEADWPDAYRINRFVRAVGEDQTPIQALGEFKRFPTWMWRNRDVLDFVAWLRSYNDNLPQDAVKAGFYGLDLYSLYNSMAAVLQYLDKIDPEAAKRARDRYACFEHFGEDSQRYGYAASFDLSQSCEDEVVNQLVELQRKAAEYAQRDGRVLEDEYFYAEQNARLIKNAEEYYRSMFRGRVSTWNLRDRHMVETLNQLVQYLNQHYGKTKVVIWAHNSHLGDARATEMGAAGEWNVGQLVRETYPKNSFSIGFSTYTGTVTAASNWDEPAHRRQVRPALKDSYENIFHQVEIPQFWLNLREPSEVKEILAARRLERAIGVIYRPETERMSHYFHANLPAQFDAILHFDETHAVEPLERTPSWDTGEVPETYPYGV
ncbi:MAG: erythromycin esterase family protein [Spirulinaceae cyanobacterium]